MKNHRLLGLLVAGLLMIPGDVGAEEADSTADMEMLNHYEAIRLALLEDSTESVAEHGKALQEKAKNLLVDFKAVSAAVPEEDAATHKATLLEIESAASGLSTAQDLTSAREGLFVLTEPMAKYRKLTGDQSTVVAYCPMAEKAWIQPVGEIGNPYLGQEMPKCGEVVGES